jgi:hypothetical protein
VSDDVRQEAKQRLGNGGSGFRNGVVLIGAALLMAVIFLTVGWFQRQATIDELTAGYAALQEQNRICRANPDDPVCGRPVAPPVGDIVDEGEVQEGELQDLEVQERERQEAERQERERQEAERQDRERQDRERQDGERQEAEAQDGERQEAEEQEAEAQDEEEQEAEEQEAEVQEDEVQDAERDDPDPNSALDFQVRDECEPAPGEAVTDVDLAWERSPGTVTLVLTCSAAAPPPPPE